MNATQVIAPFLLQVVVLPVDDLVVMSAICSAEGGAEGPGTFVAIFVPRGVVPGVAVGVGD